MKNQILYLCLLLLCIFSCRDEINEFTTTIDESPPLVLVETRVMGRVVDDAGDPVSNASVRLGSHTILSGADGFFEFDELAFQKSGDVVSADVPGFFKGVSQSSFQAAGQSFVEVRMLAKGEPDIVASTTDASIVKPNGMEISIPANSIVDSNGNRYEGNVMVFSKWIDPTDENIGGIMPGSLIALDQNNKDVVLATYGMLALELEGDGGELLSLAEGSRAEASIPIPDELIMDAPDEMPLWEYDLEEGKWFEEGKCTKKGSSYNFPVSGTGYWNCDIPLESICLSMQVFNEDLSFAPFVKVVVEDLTDNFIYWGYTDMNGFLCGSVPQSAPLKLTILDHCDNVIYMEEIGVFDDDTALEDIILETNLEEFLFNVKGTLSNCIQTDVPNGHLGVRYPGTLQIFPFSDGVFDVNLGLICTSFPEVEFTLYSNSEPSATLMETVFVFEDVDLGALQSCEDLEDSFVFEVDGSNLFASPTQYYLRSNQVTDWMVLEGLSGSGKITIELRDYQGVGVYNENAFCDIVGGALEPRFEELEGSSPSIQVEVTVDDGTFIEGNFSGILDNELGEEKSISGTFKVRKAP